MSGALAEYREPASRRRISELTQHDERIIERSAPCAWADGEPVAIGRALSGLASAMVASAAVFMMGAGCTDDGGPRLESVSPSATGRNGIVTLTGRRLCGANADCATAAGEVQLGLEVPTIRANVLSYSDTSAELMVPSLAPVGATEIVVTVNERASNALAFEVLP